MLGSIIIMPLSHAKQTAQAGIDRVTGGVFRISHFSTPGPALNRFTPQCKLKRTRGFGGAVRTREDTST